MTTPNIDINQGFSSCCRGAEPCESPETGRRSFIRVTGLSAVMLLAGRKNVMAGPFAAGDFDSIVPANKRLSKEWITGLYARGEALTATREDLKFIGMPISEIFTGQVYLGGDGQLWGWNLDGQKDKMHTPKGRRFMEPSTSGSLSIQGFALHVADQRLEVAFHG